MFHQFCFGRLAAFVVFALFLVTALVTPASAIPMTVEFDLTSPLYGSAAGGTFGSVSEFGTTLDLTSTGGTISWTAGSGFAVNGPTGLDDPNEIGFTEFLMSVVTPPFITLNSITLGDLFPNEFFSFDEKAQISINGGSWTTYTGNSGTGLLTVLFGTSSVSSIGFRSVPSGIELGFSDFNIRTINADVEIIPEPATYILMGVGLVGIGLFKKRNRWVRAYVRSQSS